MSTTVVVLSYRPGDWLAECLAATVAQADEVLLVDNGSEDARASELGRAFGARVIRSRVNRGFAPAVCSALGLARGDLVALLNDDAVPLPGWLSGSAAVLEDPSVAAVGPKLLLRQAYAEIRMPGPEWYSPGDPRPLGRQIRSVRVDGLEVLDQATGPGLHRLEGEGTDRWRWTAGERSWYVPVGQGQRSPSVVVNGEPVPTGPLVRLVNSTGLFLDHRGYAGDIAMGAPDDGSFDEARERFAVSGAAMVARAETWRAVGDLAAPYFAYYEDVDWCWRAWLYGYRVLYDPSWTVEHRRSASSGGEHNEGVRVLAERNRTLTMARNGPWPLVARALRERLAAGPDGGIRAQVARGLPWALATRVAQSRRWARSASQVWERWSGVDSEWAV